MNTEKKTSAIITIHGPEPFRKRELEIVSFTMVEPSTMTIRFQTKDGQVLQSTGLIWSATAGFDSLPGCAFGKDADCLRPFAGLAMR